MIKLSKEESKNINGGRVKNIIDVLFIDKIQRAFDDMNKIIRSNKEK